MKKTWKKTALIGGVVCAALATWLVGSQVRAADNKALYQGTVYSATRGGHMVFTTITIDPNRDMISGTVAGRLPMPNNEQADALEMSADQKYIYYPTWDTSTLYTVDITDKMNPKVVHEQKILDKPTKMCGSHLAPDGKLYFSSMAQGDIHVYDMKDRVAPKLMDRLYKTTYLCGVQSLENGKYVWTSDMKDHKVYVYESKTGKKVNEISMRPGKKEFLHRSRLSPDGKLMYQASTGAVAGEAADGRFYIIDTAKQKVVDTIVQGENYDTHDVATTPDGKYAIAAVRRVPPGQYKDSEYIVYNMQTKKAIGSISMCKSCHAASGVDPAVKSGREVFVCGIQVAWKK